jgi:hypothetical protein
MIRRKFLEKKIEKIDNEIEKAIKRNDFQAMIRLENELKKLEDMLLSTYNSRELHDLIA